MDKVVTLSIHIGPSTVNNQFMKTTICGLQRSDVEVQNEALLGTCQSQCSTALRPTLRYGLFYSKWDHNLPNEQCGVLKKKLVFETMNSVRIHNGFTMITEVVLNQVGRRVIFTTRGGNRHHCIYFVINTNE